MTEAPAAIKMPRWHPVARVFAFLAVFLAGQMAVVAAIGKVVVPGLASGQSTGDAMMALTVIAVVPLFLEIAMFCAWADRRPWSSIGLPWSRKAAALFAGGLLMGSSMVWLNVGALALLHQVSTLRLAPVVSWPLLIVYFLGFVLQSGGEELMARGYILQNLLTRYRPLSAALAQAFIFAGLHGANPGGTSALAIVNLLLFAIACAVVYLRFGNLWLLCGIHAGWNFCLANVAGLAVSGIHLSNRVCETSLGGEALLTGGEFGMEASLVNTFVWCGFLLTFALMKKRYSAPTWWERVRDSHSEWRP